MVDAFLVIAVIVLAVVLAIGIVLLIIKFGHEDDKNQAKFPKLVTFLGLWIAFATVLIVPYDVANARGTGGGLRIDVLWQILYIIIAILAFALIPFAVFFYESDTDPEQAKTGSCCDPKNMCGCCCYDNCCGSQFGQAFSYTCVFFFVFAIILIICWLTSNNAVVPVAHMKVLSSNVMSVANMSLTNPYPDPCNPGPCLQENIIWNIPTTFPIYTIALLSFIGWWFFTLFVGVGLISLPLDLINEFRTRPTPMSTKVWVEEKANLANRAAALIEIGTKFKEQLDKANSRSFTERRDDKRSFLKFEQAYYFLKKDYVMLDLSHRLKGGNPLWYILKLVLGIIGIVVSLTWIIHIAIFMLPKKPFHPFLNNYFVDLETIFGGGFPLFGILAFAIWSLYLLWCCVAGNFKLGVRFFFWKLYPMEVNNTLMNAFLINTWFILMCSVPAIHFCAMAFPIYTRGTDVINILGTQVTYMEGFHYFWENNVFIIMMLCVSFLTLVLLAVRPNDKASQIDKRISAAGAAVGKPKK